MNVSATPLNDVLVVEPRVFNDDRGFFLESYNEKAFHAEGLPTHWVQDNHSCSTRNVLRGIHYQLRNPQGKLVRVLFGEVFDVAVDLRRSSVNFGKWFGLVLSRDNRKMLWIPPGFGHGFLVLSESAEFLYKTTNFYSPEFERTLIWNDTAVGIEWPLIGEPILSEKDRLGVCLGAAEVYE